MKNQNFCHSTNSIFLSQVCSVSSIFSIVFLHVCLHIFLPIFLYVFCHFANDILSKWRVEIETPIMEEALAWLEEGQVEEEEEEEEVVVGGTMEGDVLASPLPYTPIAASSPPSITHRQILDQSAGPGPSSSSARGRPDKWQMTFPVKGGESIDIR